MLIDIQLDTLQFILYPTYEGVKEKLPFYKEAYILEYGEEYREKITDNLSKLNYVFFVDRELLTQFVKKLEANLVVESYKQLLAPFNFSYHPYIEEGTNFIEKIYVKENLFSYTQDKYLSIFRNQIRNYLVQLEASSSSDSEKSFLKEQISQLDITVEKFDQIEEVLRPTKEQLKEEALQLKKIQENLKRDFMKAYPTYLTQEEQAYIEKHPDYDVQQFLENAKYYNLILPIYYDCSLEFKPNIIYYFHPQYDQDETVQYLRKLALKRLGIEVEEDRLQEGAYLLKQLQFSFKDQTGKTYEGVEGIEMLAKAFEPYNAKWIEAKMRYCYMQPPEELTEQFLLSEKIANRRGNAAIKDLLLKANQNLKWKNQLLDSILSFGKDKVAGSCIRTILEAKETYKTIAYHISYAMRTFFLDDERNQILSDFDNNFIHELGHAVSDEQTGIISGFAEEEKYEKLNELFNQYKTGKVEKRLASIPGAIIINSPGIQRGDNSLYTANRFLLDPFLEDYEPLFNKATMENTTTILKDAFGEDTFEAYVTIVNQFFEAQEKMDPQDALCIFRERPEYVVKTKEMLFSILEQVQRKNAASMNQIPAKIMVKTENRLSV